MDEPYMKRQRTAPPEPSAELSAAEEAAACEAAGTLHEDELASSSASALPQAEQYHSVRVRQPKQQWADEQYFDWAPGRGRNGPGACGAMDSMGGNSLGGGRGGESDLARAKIEQARLAKDQARLAAEAEEAAWELPEGIELTDQVEAMLRILRELFAPKYLSFAKPFIDAAEAAELGLQRHLAEVRANVLGGAHNSIGPFAVAVRDVFAECYLNQGHPDRSALSKKCERLDAVFEQNITLLPRYLRDAASLFAAPTSVLGAPEHMKPATANSYTGRRQTQVNAVTTLRLVESFKQRAAAELDHQRARASREKRERQLAEAEAWAAEKVDHKALENLRRSFDAISLTSFLVAFAVPLGIPALAEVSAFCLLEYELALLHFPSGSKLFRIALDAMLRHSTVKNGAFPLAGRNGPPSDRALSAQLAQRLDAWGRTLHKVLKQEARGEQVDEWDYALSEGYGLREIVDRLGELPPLSAALRSEGLDALTAEQRATLLHGLVEQVLETDRDCYKRMEPSEVELTRPQMLGRDASGRWYYFFSGLTSDAAEGRLYTLSSPWKAKAQPPVPHLVRIGERVEVEVEEVKGQIEWRLASVLQLLDGGKGRFLVMVDGADGEPDEDFIEVFTAPLVGKEWRKLPPMEKKAKEAKPEAKLAERAKEDKTKEEAEAKPKKEAPPPREARKTRVSDAQAAAAAAAAAAVVDAKSSKGSSSKEGGAAGKKKASAKEPDVLAPASEDVHTFERVAIENAMQRLKGSKAKADVSLLRALASLKEAAAAKEVTAKETAKRDASGSGRSGARPDRTITPWTSAILRLHGEVQQAELDAAEAAANPPPAPEYEADPDMAAVVDAPPGEPGEEVTASAAAASSSANPSGDGSAMVGALAVGVSTEAAVLQAAGGRSARAFARQAIATAMNESREVVKVQHAIIKEEPKPEDEFLPQVAMASVAAATKIDAGVVASPSEAPNGD